MLIKIAGIILATAIGILGVWAMIKFGPKPEQDKNREANYNINNSAVAVEKPKDDNQSYESQVFNLMNIIGESVAKGVENSSADSFVKELDRRYEERGYLNYEELLKRNNPQSGATRTQSYKFYWKSCEEAFCIVVAIGDDANLHSAEREKNISQYITIIEKYEDKTSWETFRLRPNKKISDGEVDFPGQDPPLIPRIAESQRLFSSSQKDGFTVIYKSKKKIQQVKDWYLNEMTSWHFIKIDIQSINNLHGELLFFSKGQKLCTIWLSLDENNNVFILILLKFN